MPMGSTYFTYTYSIPSTKPRNMHIAPSSGDPTGALITMPTDQPSSNTKFQPSVEPDALKQGIQKAKVILQGIKITGPKNISVGSAFGW